MLFLKTEFLCNVGVDAERDQQLDEVNKVDEVFDIITSSKTFFYLVGFTLIFSFHVYLSTFNAIE